MAEIMVNILPSDRNVPLKVKIYLPIEGPFQSNHLLACDEIGPQCLSESTHMRLGNSWPPQLLYHHARCKLTSVFTWMHTWWSQIHSNRQKWPGGPRCNWNPYAIPKTERDYWDHQWIIMEKSVCTPTNRFAPGLSVEWSIRNRPDKSILERSEVHVNVKCLISSLSLCCGCKTTQFILLYWYNPSTIRVPPYKEIWRCFDRQLYRIPWVW